MQTPRPTLAPGDILFGRPLFRDRPSTAGHLHPDEHPVLVLRVACEEGNLRKTAILGIPISTSPVCTNNPYALRARPGLITGLAGKYDRDSWFCADSPNLIYIHSFDNGLRHNTRREPGWHVFKHGSLSDARAVDRVLSQTKDAMGAHSYRPPTQGTIKDIARGDLAPNPLGRRGTIIQRAADLEAAAHGASMAHMNAALQAASRPKLGISSTTRPILGLASSAPR